MVNNAKYPGATKKHLALISPLDWGLGHTTRCIPIIKELLEQNIEIVIACNSGQKQLLARDFPELEYIPLTGYNLKYGIHRSGTLSRLVLQIPKILIAIKRENLQLKRIITRYKPDFIISDNRYGFFSSTIPSIFITHQLNIRSGFGATADRFIRKITHVMIKRFTAVWVPDNQGIRSLAGELSKLPGTRFLPIRYIGPISRLQPCRSFTSGGYILAVLSGPEPQRSILEAILVPQLHALNRPAVLVRGTSNQTRAATPGKNLRVVDLAGTAELNDLMCGAALVVCRPGYTSVMDLVKLEKKAIFIPTPGQGEQEYLAAFLGNAKKAVIAEQESLNLAEAISKTSSVTVASANMELYKEAIHDLVHSLNN
ncbi:MAG: glycosyl transferase family 28 [Chitinophagaceae bacterium]|nr:MAG: glycosyl transferase family 28 [Chitinophagaceae bacterium]